MSNVELRLTANLDDAVKEVRGFKKEYADLVREVSKPLKQVTGFRELGQTLESTQRQVGVARDRVRELANELARAEKPAKELQADYRNAAGALKQLERQESSQIAQLRRYRAELVGAGVDVANLSAEQRRLSSELSSGLQAGRADAALSAARDALGVGAIEETQRELAQLRQQYQLVARDGSLSAKQRGEAESAYRRSVGQTLAALRQLRAATVLPPSKADAAQALRAEADAAGEAARQNQLLAAQRALGVGRIRGEQQELVKLREQYRLVMSDATLTGRQRAEAEAVYHRSVSTTLARLRDLRAATAQQESQAQRAATAQAQRAAQAQAGIRAQGAAVAQAAREQRIAALEAARNDLGVNRARSAQAAIQQLVQQYELLRQRGGLTARELAIAQQTLNRLINESRQSMRELAGEQLKLSAGSGQIGFGGAAGLVGGAYGAARAASAYIQITDLSKQMDAQLRLVTKSQDDFNQAQVDTYRIAQDNKAPLEDVTRLYARLTPALADVGRGQREVAGVTEALTASLRISGATQSETASTLTQFSQALGSGVLRGEEFNAIAENAPRLLRALADGLNVPTGALRNMASEGELTADVITDLTLQALPQLIEEAKKLPETVESTLTKLRNDAIKAFGDGDTSGFINAINQLRALLTDPQVVQGLADLAGGMATLAGWTVIAASEFAGLAKEAAYAAAVASGYIDELAKLEKTLEGVNAARSGGQIIGRPTATFFMSAADLDAWAKELEGKIEETRARINGVTVKQQRDQQEAAAAAAQTAQASAAELDSIRVAELDEYRAYVKGIKTIQEEQVKAAEAGAKKLVSAERKAVSELAKVKAERVKIEERYKEALAGLGGDGAASYGNAQALKVGAREALAGGDIATAQAQAQAALKMLQDLAAAGENTYGFSGFIKELQAIELAANDIEQTNAENKIAAIREQIKSLEADAAALKDMPLSIKSDEASIEAVRTQIQQLVADMGKQAIVLPVRVAHPDGPIVADLPPLPQFAAGGKLRGPGTGTSDSILMWGSNGEFMQPEASVNYYGEAFMEAIRQRRLPKFAEGGLIGQRSLPAIPQINPTLLQANDPLKDWGRATLESGGNSIEVLMKRDSFDRVLRRTATKFGGTHK